MLYKLSAYLVAGVGGCQSTTSLPHNERKCSNLRGTRRLTEPQPLSKIRLSTEPAICNVRAAQTLGAKIGTKIIFGQLSFIQAPFKTLT
jgi:hypothetical protein